MSDTFNQSVSTVAQLNVAILEADSLASGATDTITFTGNIALDGAQLTALNIASDVTLDINGGGYTIDGGGTQRGLFVYAGSVDVSDLTIADTKALGGAGGSGNSNSGGGGGGGAGLGGGLFIGSNVAGDAGDVTLTGVTFSGDAATGGNGTNGLFGGGGGLGGNAGSGDYSGGGGIGGNGGNTAADGQPGIVPKAAKGGGSGGI
ncbi:hypothetical protein, partial [Acidisphaera rubrifaciens]|uniref:hypothetical protein n=1 Tax=Acidisphaera rubrifaciens TaxID=50715 RepID=UPI0006626F35